MIKQKISTYFWFDSQAKEAAEFYCSLFNNSRIMSATPMIVVFELEGLQYYALNGGPHFKLNEAASLFVECEDQEEVDRYWKALTENGGEESMCGWLKDRYGLWWQIIPSRLMALMSDKDPKRAERAMQAMLKMKGKIIIQKLEEAADGRG